MVVGSVSVPEESDFSPRKLKVAAAIIVGTDDAARGKPTA